jgi:hypothetical protein
VRVGVRVDDVALLRRVRQHLPPAWRPPRTAVVDYLYSIRTGGRVPGSNLRRFYLVYAGSTQIVRTLEEDRALETFESAVRLDVATWATRWVFVHAGAVGWQGKGIVIPAPSRSGKSRLVEALVRAGATYYSDEFAVLDSRGRLHPFA